MPKGYVLKQEEIEAIDKVVRYLFDDESDHYIECGQPRDHIFNDVKILENFLWEHVRLKEEKKNVGNIYII